ncbi:MAG: 50S ribosomal protein L32e [Nitrososphaeria archaeon]|nr:50S ribosomal protein L32e [Nitrososphaeria archaeon]
MSPTEIPKWVRKLKVKRPEFVRQESWKYIRLKPNWRRPRGKDSKMRLQIKGWPPLVKIGYRTPRKYRGLHPSGYEEVLIYKPEDLQTLDPSIHAVRIAGSVGMRKRAMIVEEAKKLGLKVLNPPMTLEKAREEVEVVEPELEGAAEEAREVEGGGVADGS